MPFGSSLLKHTEHNQPQPHTFKISWQVQMIGAISQEMNCKNIFHSFFFFSFFLLSIIYFLILIFHRGSWR